MESDPDWAEKFPTTSDGHVVVLWPGENVEDYLLQSGGMKFDLAFVDGPVDSRVPCVQRLFSHSPMIVFHDSLTRCYGWGRLVISEGWSRVDFIHSPPATSVLVKEPCCVSLIQDFCDNWTSDGPEGEG